MLSAYIPFTGAKATCITSGSIWTDWLQEILLLWQNRILSIGRESFTPGQKRCIRIWQSMKKISAARGGLQWESCFTGTNGCGATWNIRAG